MKGSQELIAHFHKRKEELGEKASKLNMFLEGYAAGYNDTKACMIDKYTEFNGQYQTLTTEAQIILSQILLELCESSYPKMTIFHCNLGEVEFKPTVI